MQQILGHLYLHILFSSGDVKIGCTTRVIPGVRSPNAQCIFPFKYNGTTEHKCLQSPAWCSTLVDDESGEHIGGWRRNRGYCEDNCNDKIGKKYLIMYVYLFLIFFKLSMSTVVLQCYRDLIFSTNTNSPTCT